MQVTDEMVEQSFKKLRELEDETKKQEGYWEGYEAGKKYMIEVLEDQIEVLQQVHDEYKNAKYPMRYFSQIREINSLKKTLSYLPSVNTSDLGTKEEN